MRPAGTVVRPSTSRQQQQQQQNSQQDALQRRHGMMCVVRATYRDVQSSDIVSATRQFLLANVALIFAITLIGALVGENAAMRIDPERIAARLRIEEKIWNDRVSATRRRRQLSGSPKEETIQVTAPLFSGRLFDYGPTAGDREATGGLDVGKKLQLTRPLGFYGRNYSAIYILSNGGIGFDSNAHTYRANVLPGNTRLISPFWNRNELRNGGHVYYREVTRKDEAGGRALERGQSEIRYQYDHEVKVQSAIIVTWDKMQPLGTTPLPDENTNTFQAALFVTAEGRTYANFIYSNIGWTQGAEAGFSNGDNANHYALPTSGTGNIMYLEDYGNTGIPGEWMFALDDRRVHRCKAGIKGDTCDEKCNAGEWGADCESCCRCASGVACNEVSGVCGTGTKLEQTCADCWSGKSCQTKSETCARTTQKTCAANAALIVDHDRCGEPTERCECLAGFEGNGERQCRDVDECAQPGTCHENAVCTNTPGHFFCQCVAGFNGDGVTECVASFLYPHERAQKLSHSRNAKVAWKLKTPLKLFGSLRDRIIISSKGLIIVKEKTKVRPEDHLDDMDILGFAPFFAPIDYTINGEVSVSETTDADVLTRVTQLVNENLAGEARSFRAASVVIISFMNVSSPGVSGTNTFQTLLIGGINDEGERMSFVQFLYKDLVWSDSAEAGIMTADKTNSIHLPGSGTAGIEQLSQLSNIRTPGIWMYRIDSDTLLPCMTAELQPPYCDAQSPTLVSARRSDTTTTISLQTNLPTTPLTVPITETRHQPHPVLDASLPSPHRFQPPAPAQFPPPLDERIDLPVTIVPPALSRGKLRGHTPTFTSHEISDIPSDVFDDFSNLMTVVPQLITAATANQPSSSSQQPQQQAKDDDHDGAVFSLPGVSIIQPEIIETIAPSSIATTTATAAIETITLTIEPPSSSSSPSQVEPERKIEKPNIDFSRDSNNVNSHADNNGDEQVIEIEPKETVIMPELPAGPSQVEQQQVPAEPTIVTTIEPTTEVTNITTNQLFVFTTTTKKPNTPKKPKYVIQKAKPSTTESTIEENTAVYDPSRVLDAEAPANKFAVVVIASVIASWLLVLIGMIIYVACKRRRNQDMLRAMYGPGYQIRPIGVGFTSRGGEKHQHHYETSYEDHLEKAARLSSELSAYNPNGRMSLYSPYWNMSNSSHSSPDGSQRGDENARHSPNTVTSPTSTAVVDDDAETTPTASPYRGNAALSNGLSGNVVGRRGAPDGGLPKYSPSLLASGDDFSPLITAGRYRPSYVTATARATSRHLVGCDTAASGGQRVILPPHHILLPAANNSANSYLPYTRYPPNMMRH